MGCQKEEKKEAVFTLDGSKIEVMKSSGRTSVIIPTVQKYEFRNGSISHDHRAKKRKNNGCKVKNGTDPEEQENDCTKKIYTRSSRKCKRMG